MTPETFHALLKLLIGSVLLNPEDELRLALCARAIAVMELEDVLP